MRRLESSSLLQPGKRKKGRDDIARKGLYGAAGSWLCQYLAVTVTIKWSDGSMAVGKGPGSGVVRRDGSSGLAQAALTEGDKNT